MASVGELFVQIGADLRQFERAMQRVQRNMQQVASTLGTQGDQISGNFEGSMDNIQDSLQSTQQMINNMNLGTMNTGDLERLPDHLKPFAQAIRETQGELRELGRGGTMTLEQIQDAATRTATGLGNMTSATAGGKKAIKVLENMRKETNAARLAVMGLSRDGKVKLTTEQSQKALKDYQDQVAEARKELEKLKASGNFAAYEAGMQQLNEQTFKLNRTMKVVANGGQGLESELLSLGIALEGIGDRAAIGMERMKDSFINANKIMQARATQSSKIMKNLARMDVRGLDQQFLKIGDKLERMARRGTAANLALLELGEGASMKDLRDQVTLINQGLMRMQALQMGMGIGFLAYTAAMVALSNELDGRLIPAAEAFKSVWLDALEPFVKQWTTAATAVIDFGTYLGGLVNKFSEAHPIIFGMIGNITYLATALMVLLAPLAIGISRANSFRAAFHALWMIIGPFVTGFLAVVGTALAVATAIVGVTYAINLMWKKSEAFRSAVVGLWDNIKKAWELAMNGVKDNLGVLGNSWIAFLGVFFGGATSFEEKWKIIGDNVAAVINFLSPLIITTLSGAFKILAAVAGPVIQFLSMAIQKLAMFWLIHGDQIKLAVQILGQQIQSVFTRVASFIGEVLPVILGIVMQGFTAVFSFIQSIMPQIQKLISVAFEIGRDIIFEVLPAIVSLVQAVLPIILAVFKFVFPLILAIVKMIWTNIKLVITSGIAIILNVIDMFKNIAAGKWSAVWENIKAILKNAVTFLWNLVQLILIGRMIKGIMLGWKALVAGTKAAWTKWVNGIKKAVSDSKEHAVRTITNLKTSLNVLWEAMRTGTVRSMTGLKAGVRAIWVSLKSIASTAFNNVKTAILKPIEVAKDKVLGIIDKIKQAFANMSIRIPKPTLPKIVTGSKTILGATIPTFDVQWNAKGGIMPKNMIAGNQGFSEKGLEAALPLQNRRYMKPFSNAVGQFLADQIDSYAGGGQVVSNEFNIAQLVVREEADIEKIAAILEKKQREQTRAKGGFVYA